MKLINYIQNLKSNRLIYNNLYSICFYNINKFNYNIF